MARTTSQPARTRAVVGRREGAVGPVFGSALEPGAVSDAGTEPTTAVPAQVEAGTGAVGTTGQANVVPTLVAEDAPAPAAAGSADLAGGLRRLLSSIDAEVRAVSALSEGIDELVTKLNTVRDEQATRLLELDVLRQSVDDAGLGSFLDKAIRPRRTRVAELVPERLTQD